MSHRDQTNSKNTSELLFFIHFSFQTNENALIKTRFGIHSGVCIHNGIVHKNKDEWTVDDCTECTCQVRPQVLDRTCVGGALHPRARFYMRTPTQHMVHTHTGADTLNTTLLSSN